MAAMPWGKFSAESCDLFTGSQGSSAPIHHIAFTYRCLGSNLLMLLSPAVEHMGILSANALEKMETKNSAAILFVESRLITAVSIMEVICLARQNAHMLSGYSSQLMLLFCSFHLIAFTT